MIAYYAHIEFRGISRNEIATATIGGCDLRSGRLP
jgi:hypothetical protein